MYQIDEFVSKLHIINSAGNIFDTDIEYVIPLYQRAYAWEDKQLTQLIEDIMDVSLDDNYYIGALIVSQHAGKYEVVDGQQRLTSLFLLLNCLGYSVKNSLTFACREKSNYTLKNIGELLSENRSKLDMDRIEAGLQRGMTILNQELNRDGFDKEEFIKKLSKVVIYRIEVPKNTDLNRYFEIMNTRGEQLEQHDILKAMLMSYLDTPADHFIFSKIWDACSDMTGYVQMHFISRLNEVRESIFGGGWNHLPSKEWKDYEKAIQTDNWETGGHTIRDIIDINFKVEDDEGYIDDDVRVRFESIIEYPFFLLHVLKVFIAENQIQHEDGKTPIIAELLDDKKLIDSFKKVITNGVTGAGRVSDKKADFSRGFIICLLRTRFLFDRYIVKREYANDSADGEWSLKSLFVSGQQTKKKPYYRNSKFTKTGEWNSTNDWRTKTNIMLQSALRVSYTSPKVMHWITQLLIWLSEDDCVHLQDEYIVGIESITEDIAKKAVRENFFDVCKDGSFAMGVNTPHIVFNYLDYLLWNSDRKKYSDFDFEFRNSVEHWYPQNPSEGTFEQWKDGVDQFGNLCIIQRNVNSKFSNMSPEAKKSTFKDMIAKGSLKLRIMSELTEKHDNKVASLYWKETQYRCHEEKMINILKEACNVNTAIVFPDSDEGFDEEKGNIESRTQLDVATIMYEWSKAKEATGAIHVDDNKCGKMYCRFTTDAMSQIMPESETADSGWATRNHYFYEIVNKQGKKLFMQFAMSGKNLSEEQRKICNRINEISPSRTQKENWQWKLPFVSKRVGLDETTTKEDISRILDESYEEIMDFEQMITDRLLE
ncbi:DUF262 domain-containing protein [Butyrivibrio sp. NC2002]|uniref:DUF262 domain-containing protein n=1 Tax=Butyrivibrio sp. NC2002 TaxID=1410610 RepID=UPI000ADE18DC|nr:DUF262 domain-containing protein [Butyrivibrio sp. NC2002]